MWRPERRALQQTTVAFITPSDRRLMPDEAIVAPTMIPASQHSHTTDSQ